MCISVLLQATPLIRVAYLRGSFIRATLVSGLKKCYYVWVYMIFYELLEKIQISVTSREKNIFIFDKLKPVKLVHNLLQ